MAFIRATEPGDQVAAPKLAAQYRSREELKMRESLSAWGRARWPEARQIHELVMSRGTVRADMAFASPADLVAVEIKSEHDNTARLCHQVCMFRLAVPELWVAFGKRHAGDAALIRYLLPSVGLLSVDGESVEVVAAAERFAPHPEALLSLLWVAELHTEARAAGLLQSGKPPTHAGLVKLLSSLNPDQQLVAVARQLRGRDAFWRADPPIRLTPPEGSS